VPGSPPPVGEGGDMLPPEGEGIHHNAVMWIVISFYCFRSPISRRPSSPSARRPSSPSRWR